MSTNRGQNNGITIFDHQAGVVMAEITSIGGNGEFYFATNDYGRNKFFCHLLQGGRPTFTPAGDLALNPFVRGEDTGVRRGTMVALVQQSQDPQSAGFTKATAWMPLGEWNRHKKMVPYAKELFTAVAFNRVNFHKGNPQELPEEKTLCTATLGRFLSLYPRGVKGDPLAQEYRGQLRPGVIETYMVRWERYITKAACSDPRILLA